MSPNGQRLAVGSDGPTYLNELETGSNISVLVDRYVKDRIAIWSVQFSPNGQLLVTGASDGQIRIWNIILKRMRAIFKGHKSGVYDVVFSPDGRSLVSASDDQSVRIWNVRGGSSNILGSHSQFLSVAFSPDGRYIAAGDYGHSLWIWDSRTHRLLTKWRGHRDSVWCTRFTPDGNGLISGGSTAKYWNVGSIGNREGESTGMLANEEKGLQEVGSFLGHNGPVRSIAFFPNNTHWMVTGSDDHTVRVWDTESGVCQLTIQGHMHFVRGVDVSRTQNFLTTAGADGHVVVWKYELL